MARTDSTCWGKQQVDVVITDINMPRMDGYEVIRQLRNNPAHKTTPILVLTTESETDKKISRARPALPAGWSSRSIRNG